ncbi:CLUMA_CG000041, isoform A [Clunio marinus]|uniref:Phosphatidylcholine transfer protein n=1 Tax=Clunio marinus TaxID=568069 RepID=A0A1J1HEH4_9DIPT|nr:CLUMA_CG000041, isoform A [Clunio marinus]
MTLQECRICDSKEGCYDIFKEELNFGPTVSRNVKVYIILNNFLYEKLYTPDEHSSFICHLCCNKLCDSYSFMTAVRKSEQLQKQEKVELKNNSRSSPQKPSIIKIIVDTAKEKVGFTDTALESIQNNDISDHFENEVKTCPIAGDITKISEENNDNFMEQSNCYRELRQDPLDEPQLKKTKLHQITNGLPSSITYTHYEFQQYIEQDQTVITLNVTPVTAERPEKGNYKFDPLLTNSCDTSSIYKCKHCIKAFSKAEFLLKHTTTSHLCLLCMEIASNYKELSDHMRKFHSSINCAFCGAMTLLKLPRLLSKRTSSKNSRLELIKNQIDFFWSSRLRRSIQVYNFYRKIWDEKALREFLRHMKSNFFNRNRKLLLSSLGLFLFDWEKERIELDETVQEFFNEFERIEFLKFQATFSADGKVQMSKDSIVGSNHEQCNKYRLNDMEDWEFYVRRNNMTTWRRQEDEGHYAYKVYVSYPDITAEDFLFVQTNIDYRRKWDDTAVALDVIDTDKFDRENGQVIYWEMLWPKLFSNRDYVFVQKHFIDKQRNLILIVNKSTKHPKCPVRPGLQRVKEYWSFMVIKPKTTFNEPGLEFILTYYDNPGIKIPAYVTSWVAQRQLPDFIEKLYNVTFKHAENRKLMKWEENHDPGYEYPSDIRLDEFESNAEDEMEDNVNSMNRTNEDEEEAAQYATKTCEENENSESSDQQRRSWWSYLLPYNYLH